jgi:hypothetical protein
VKLPIQKILFGSPGTGKSYKIDREIIPKDLGITSKDNIVKTVFHPEYTYGDFMGKLVPITNSQFFIPYYYKLAPNPDFLGEIEIEPKLNSKGINIFKANFLLIQKNYLEVNL